MNCCWERAILCAFPGLVLYLGQVMRKCVFSTFVVRCLHSMICILALSKSFKILASFCNWAGWFESYLVENPWRHIFVWYGSLDAIFGGCFPSPCGRFGRMQNSVEPCHKKTCLRCFRPGKTQTGLLSWWDQLESWNFWYSKCRYYPIYIVNNKGADQTAWMRRLMCTFVVCIWHKIGFLMTRLSCIGYWSLPLPNISSSACTWGCCLRNDLFAELYLYSKSFTPKIDSDE